MGAAVLKQNLRRLHELILLERECARTLAMDELQRTLEEKGELLSAMDGLAEGELDAEDRALAEAIRHANRRNAYLYWAGLGWVREMMGFFGRQSAPMGYGAAGIVYQAPQGGRLLSGRV
jgi:hypothetical protein